MFIYRDKMYPKKIERKSVSINNNTNKTVPQKPELSLVLILKAVFCDTFFVGSVPMGMCKKNRPNHF